MVVGEGLSKALNLEGSGVEIVVVKGDAMEVQLLKGSEQG